MDSDLPIGFFDLRQKLDEAGAFHRVGSLREETVVIEVRLPTSFWEIELHSDGTVEYEVFRSTGAILAGEGVHDFDADVLRDLLASARQAATNWRRGLRDRKPQ